MQKHLGGLVFREHNKINYIDGKYSAWIDFKAIDRIDVEVADKKDDIDASAPKSAYEFAFSATFSGSTEKAKCQDIFGDGGDMTVEDMSSFENAF